jgi:hypothetical protein
LDLSSKQIQNRFNASSVIVSYSLLQVKSNSFSGLTGSVGSSESETLSQNYIFDALRNDKKISLCRALGIICFIITEPYWKIAADISYVMMVF